MADVVQQFLIELNATVNGRLDMMNNISVAIQKMSANSKPYGSSDFITRNCEDDK